MKGILDVIKNRRSIRAYTNQQISEEQLNAILEAAMWAPSAHNTQPWHFTVIQNQDVLNVINEHCKAQMSQSPVEWVAKMGQSPMNIFYNAPTVIIVSGKQFEFFNPLVDCSAAIQNMLLAAEGMGLGSCWIGLTRFFFSDKDKVQDLLKLPEGYEPFYSVCIGHKKVQPDHGPKRKEGLVAYIR